MYYNSTWGGCFLVKATLQHVCRRKLHDSIHEADFMTQNMTQKLVDSVMHSFYLMLMHRRAMLDCNFVPRLKLQLWGVFLIMQLTGNSKNQTETECTTSSCGGTLSRVKRLWCCRRLTAPLKVATTQRRTHARGEIHRRATNHSLCCR